MPETEVIDSTDLGIGAGDNHCAIIVEHLPEFAEVGVIGRSFDHQAVFFLTHVTLGRNRAESRIDTGLYLHPQQPVVFSGVLRAAEGGKDWPDIIYSTEIGIDGRGFVFCGLQHPHQIIFRLGGFPHIFAQTIDVELDAADLLQCRDHLLFQLLDHILAHIVGNLAVPLVGHMQHDRGALVLVAQKLEPLQEGEAAGIGQQQDVRLRQPLARGADISTVDHTQIGFHIGADILGMTRPLGIQDEIA